MKKLFLLIFLVVIFFNYNYSQGVHTTLEFCTGTWCQYCPCGDQVIEGLLPNHPNTIVLAYHGPLNYGDPFAVFNGNNILNLMGFNSYPTGVIGRQSGIQNRGSWAGWVNVSENSYPPSVTFSMTKSYNSGTKSLSVTANVTSVRQIDTACYIEFIITEDNVVYPQTGNTSAGCIGGSNYIHKWIVRNIVNGATGESLGATSWPANTMRTKTWTTTLDNTWVDANCNFQVFVYFQGSDLTANSNVQQGYKNGVVAPLGVENQQPVASEYSLSQNWPNPFNPTTNVKFSIPKDGNVSLKIYDIKGSVVATYIDGFVKAGIYNAEIDGSNLSSGVYFYTLKTADFQQTKKMMLVK